MQAVILAAGRGTRMGALTATVPKPMLPLYGKPKLEHSLLMLPDIVTEVILVVGYLGDVIKKHFGTAFHGRPIRYVEQHELNGSGGAIHLVRNMVKEKFLVLMGDDLYHPEDLADLAREEQAVLGMMVLDAEQYGLLETDILGNLVRITERPHNRKSGVVNTGAYLLHPRFFEYPLVAISETEYGLPQTLAAIGQDVPVKVLDARAWQPIGRPEDIPLGEQFVKEYGNYHS